MKTLAVIGFGYWGPNIVRNFSRIDNVTIKWVADTNPLALKTIPSLYPTIQVTSKISDIINDKTVDAVIIVTPPNTHFALAKQCLTAGKHVLVEKPMTDSVNEGKKLVTLAQKKKRILMVDHTFIYTPAVEYIKKCIDQKVLGDVYAVESVRTNLGLFQKQTNVIQDLAVHDFSILDYLFDSTPKTIAATGFTQKGLGQASVAHITATYKNGMFVHLHVSWLSPMKIRQMIFVGTKKMLIYDDMEPTEKIKIYDKGVSFVKNPQEAMQLRIGYRSGDIIVPAIPVEEGLAGMAREFIRAISTNKTPLTNGRMGLSVVQSVSRATHSLTHGGKTV